MAALGFRSSWKPARRSAAVLALPALGAGTLKSQASVFSARPVLVGGFAPRRVQARRLGAMMSQGVDHLRALVRPRDLLIHDGAALRRFHVSTLAQIACGLLALLVFAMALTGLAILLARLPIGGSADPVTRMRAEVVRMRADMRDLRAEAERHAHRLEQRQAALDALIAGKVPGVLPAAATPTSATGAVILAPLKPVEANQAALARRMRVSLDARYVALSVRLAQAGFDPARLQNSGVKAMGGPYEPVIGQGGGDADPEFRQLFQSWQRLDQLQRGSVAIPSARPVANMALTSHYGVRSDPFRGSAAMHSGIDIPGPIGTAIYATADGVVGRAGWAGGYGNLVELSHGGGINTRYGHLSEILVAAGQRVHKGQLIARMGSTGRSTGSHLHYEVRIDGQAVNPMPFLNPGGNYAAYEEVEDLEALGGPGDE